MNSKQDKLGKAFLISEITIFIIGLILIVTMVNAENKDDENKKYVYYDVPTYTTVYDIIYPDSTYRYTAVHHSPSRLRVRKGSNFLYSKRHYGPLLFDGDRPDYWIDE